MQKNEYFLTSTLNYYLKNKESRENFLKKKNFLFDEISKALNYLINDSNYVKFFCCGNSSIVNKVNSKNIYINEINNTFINSLTKSEIKKEDEINKNLNFDHIVIADIEHQKFITKNLIDLNEKIDNECRVIVLSKSIFWSTLINFYKKIKNIGPDKNNFLPYSNLRKIFLNTNFEIVKNEKIIFFPFQFSLLTKFINQIFRFPVLNFFCMINLTVLKKVQKKNYQAEGKKISFIIPCKNEGGNIKFFYEKIINSTINAEFLFGNDNSSDNTLDEIKKLQQAIPNKEIKIYDGPGVCKSENVYKGINLASGEIILIYDADLTVSFDDLVNSINLLLKTDADFINCTRMIMPQQKNAMKFLNFYGNLFFAFLFSILFKQKITDTLCGTKIFFKKDWEQIKKYNNTWGAKDLWGDFDLLLGAYKNNLKIVENPISYTDRKEDETKMTGIIKNSIRMLIITFVAYYKLRIRNH
tara:strand:+ start:1495 stop:2904 length:1410 start_codon:yes stop_codon:yes gene_type:complete